MIKFMAFIALGLSVIACDQTPEVKYQQIPAAVAQDSKDDANKTDTSKTTQSTVSQDSSGNVTLSAKVPAGSSPCTHEQVNKIVFYRVKATNKLDANSVAKIDVKLFNSCSNIEEDVALTLQSTVSGESSVCNYPMAEAKLGFSGSLGAICQVDTDLAKDSFILKAKICLTPATSGSSASTGEEIDVNADGSDKCKEYTYKNKGGQPYVIELRNQEAIINDCKALCVQLTNEAQKDVIKDQIQNAVLTGLAQMFIGYIKNENVQKVATAGVNMYTKYACLMKDNAWATSAETKECRDSNVTCQQLDALQQQCAN